MSKLHHNAAGQKMHLRKRFEANAAAGEKLVGSEYWVEFEGFPGLSILVRTAQLPEMTREDVEDYAPGGVKSSSYGVLRNQTEFQMQCAETITGTVLNAFKDIILNKKYININFYLSPESFAGEREPIRKMEYCRIGIDAVDFASEDIAQVVRPSIRVICNWQE